MHRIVVSDTTAITHLAKISALPILRQLYSEILIPEAVFNELSQADRTQPGALQALNAAWIKTIQIKDRTLANKLTRRLDLGEAEAITLAVEANADVLIIDEVAGRVVAKKLGRKIIGMLGILLEAKNANIISRVKPYMDRLRDTGFRMHNNIYEFVLTRAGESRSDSNAG